MKPRKLLFVTGSRGEYGYIRPLLRQIEKDDLLSYKLVATNMHLLPTFGNTIDDFHKDGFAVHYKPSMTLAGYNPASMMKSLCVFGLSITDILEQETPDIILLAGDRGEQFIAAMAGAHMNIPVAHIQAGEVSGNIDGLTRHAMARYVHIHFAANEDAAERLRQSGEQAFRIHNVGAPQLDEFMQEEYTPIEAIQQKYNINPETPLVLVLQHSVTEEFADAEKQMEITLAAVSELGYQTTVVYPNCDAGSTAIQRAIHKYQRPNIKVYRNLPRSEFIGLMKAAAVMVGNSSAGLLEAPTFKLPAVNIGRRQRGRVQGANVINAEHEKDKIIKAIVKALSPTFKQGLSDLKNPYGDGKSSERILQLLKTIPIDEKLLLKELTI